ncbi:hypothetical protein JXC34_06505, partial [Candidatus Woesearchaeota archaeon]|nr:hypothetical protein [Candidatus Woesearchaeota archaeon]
GVKHIFRRKNFMRYPINPFSNHLGFVKYIPEQEKTLFLHMHIGGVTGRNLTYLKSQHLLEHRRKKGFFYIPSPEDEFLVVVLHAVLDRSKIKEEYRKRMEELFSRKLDNDYITQTLSEVLGDDYARRVLELIKRKRFAELEGLSTGLKKEFLRRYPNRHLCLMRVYWLGALWKACWLLKSKPLISFIGMDGSGKTTASNNVLGILKKNNFKVTRVYTGRGRNNLLPIQAFGAGYKKIGGKGSLGKEEKGKKRYSVMHTLSAPVFAMDLWLRYFFRILPLRKTNHFVITDRYSTDILLMNKVPMWLKKTLFALFPKPTIVFYLYNHPKVLYKRKMDHPIHDLYRQERIFSMINKTVKPYRIRTETEGDTHKKIMGALFENEKIRL